MSYMSDKELAVGIIKIALWVTGLWLAIEFIAALWSLST